MNFYSYFISNKYHIPFLWFLFMIIGGLVHVYIEGFYFPSLYYFGILVLAFTALIIGSIRSYNRYIKQAKDFEDMHFLNQNEDE